MNIQETFPHWSVRTLNTMRINGIETVEDLCALTEKQLLRFPNFGRLSLTEVVAGLSAIGMSLKGPSTVRATQPTPKGPSTDELLAHIEDLRRLIYAVNLEAHRDQQSMLARINKLYAELENIRWKVRRANP